jgi:four helix bundle protein
MAMKKRTRVAKVQEEIRYGKVQQFEDLIAWQKGRRLAVDRYRASRKGKFAQNFALSGQVQRAGVSIPSNIAEGFERGTRAEFHRFLSTAKGSCAELRTQLYLASDLGYLTDDQFTHLMTQAQEVSRIIGGLRTAVRRQRDADRRRTPRD